jgi:hypothetical protein
MNIRREKMIFEYRDMNKREEHCDIQQIGNIVVMTELWDNTGASITNSCEYIAKQYAEQHELNVDELIFIERYDYRSYEMPLPRKNKAKYAGESGRAKQSQRN